MSNGIDNQGRYSKVKNLRVLVLAALILFGIYIAFFTADFVLRQHCDITPSSYLDFSEGSCFRNTLHMWGNP